MSERKIEISPSVLGADLMNLGNEIRRVEELGIGWLHLDHMDGHFVPNISFGPDFVRAMRRQTELFLDVHLMLSEPMKYIETYAKAGADLITVHVEADDDAETMLRAIAAQGVKAGLSIKPATPAKAIEPLLPLCDLVLVMTVEPGFGGQSLREDCIAKIPELKDMIKEHVTLTNSEKGKEILDNFSEYLPKFKKVIPYDYNRMLMAIVQMEEKGLNAEQAQIEAFYANTKN